MAKPALSTRISEPGSNNRGVDTSSGVRKKSSRSSKKKGTVSSEVEPRNFDAGKGLAKMSQAGDTKDDKSQTIGYKQGQSQGPTNAKNSSSSGGFYLNHRQEPSDNMLQSYSASNQSIPAVIPGINEVKEPMMPPSSARKSLSVDSNFPSYYMDHRDSLSQNDTDFIRQRGDSILYHPQFTNPPRVSGSDYNATSSRQGNSRANSIFSSLIQLPASSENSVSGPGEIGNVQQPTETNNDTNNSNSNNNDNNDHNELPNFNKANDNDKPKHDTAGGNSSGLYGNRQQSVFQSISGIDQISVEELEALLNKESLGNILAWQQSQDSRNLQSKDKGGQNEYPIYDNNLLTGSVSGFNESVGEILAGLSNGSIDFSSMTNQQRRDSILKLLSDSQSLKRSKLPSSSSERTTLREDIFENSRMNSTRISNGTIESEDPRSSRGAKSNESSISYKTSKYPDEPQSPKASPTFSTTLKPPQYGTINYRSQENGVSGGVINNYQNPAAQGTVDYGAYGQPVVANSGNVNKYGQEPFIHQAPLESAPNVQPTIGQSSHYQDPPTSAFSNTNTDEGVLVPAQQYVKSEDGRPLLGVTKVDQLMLVIQARDKGVKSPIRQAPDGSILQGQNEEKNKQSVFPQPVSLVGGVDKPGKRPIEEQNGSDDKESKLNKKKRNKNQQCPYCFKYFTQSTHLEVHVRSHIGYKPFVCSYCSKRFTQGGNLRTHLRLHTGEKPFTCEICSRSFSRKGNLAAHKLTHENLKPYHCRLDDCDKSFTQLGNLKSHQNRFHLATLNNLTQRLAELSGPELDNLPKEEKELLSYFKDLYKNSNKGIRGRGKRSSTAGNASQSPMQIPAQVNTQFIPSKSEVMNQKIPMKYPVNQNPVDQNNQMSNF